MISACTGAWKPSAGGVGRNVVHPAVGDEERAGDALDRHVRQRRGQRAEQLGAVGLAVGLAGFDDADLEALDLLQAVDQRFARLLGLAGCGCRTSGSGSCRPRRRRPRTAARGPRG